MNVIHSVKNWERFKAENIKFSKPPIRKDIDDNEIKRMLQDGLTIKEISQTLKCHQNTIYKRISKWKGEEE